MIEELRPDLFRIEVPLPDSPLKSLNSYVVRAADRSLVIDTGLNRGACEAAMREGLRALALDPARTDFFVTHMHADHFGLVSKLKSPTSRVYFNRPEAEIIEAWGGWDPMVAYAAANGFPEADLRRTIEQHPGFKFSSDWVPETRRISDGDSLAVGAYRFRCVSTPGHSLGHMCLYEPGLRLLVAGDHILGDITPNLQCWSDVFNPLARYLDSLDRVRALEIDLLLPGHRGLVHDPRGRIDALKAHHVARLEEIMGLLDAGPANAYQVAAQMRWDIACASWQAFPPAQKWFAMGEAIAHLRYLESRGQLVRRAGRTGFVFARPADGDRSQ